MTDPKRGEGKPLKYDPDVSDKGLQQCMPGRNTRKKAPCGAQDGRVVEIGGLDQAGEHPKTGPESAVVDALADALLRVRSPRDH